MFENINIVLLETSHPGNIGATARAMKVMGLNKLSLVDPKDFPSDDSFALAVGCKDVLRKAKIFKNLSDSLEESEINIGFSSRKRRAKVPELTIDQCVDLINMNPKKKISILFGNEQSGLSNKELLICDYIVTIPTFKAYRSLNLSAAVQIFVYELFKRSFKPMKESSKSSRLATTKEKNYFFKEFINLITETNFIAKKNAQSLTQKIHIIFNKAALDRDEINILLGIIASINRKIRK